MNEAQIYLDHAAATPLDAHVKAAMEPYFSDMFYNPSAPYAPALQVRRDYEAAKRRLASAIGASGNEIIMTAGATESINLALRGVTGHIITTAVEHHAVLRAAEALNATIASVDERGRVSVDAIRDAIRPDTVLISVQLANNEIGTIQPLREISELVKSVRQARLEEGNATPLYLHSDASQGVGQLDVHVARLGVDMLTLNAGKVYGPKQVGLLWAARHVELSPLVLGGGQERNLRSGTENVAGTIGFAEALTRVTERRAHEAKRLSALRDLLQKSLLDAFPEAVVSGNVKHRLAGHLHMSFPNLDAERVLFALEARGVLVATGSACAANKGTRSHVLTAINLAPEVADGSLRMTLGKLTDDYAVEHASQIIIEEITREYERSAK